MSFTIKLVNPPYGGVTWTPTLYYTSTDYYQAVGLALTTIWTCPLNAGTGKSVNLTVVIINSQGVGIYLKQVLGVTVKNGAAYEYDCNTNKLNEVTTPPPEYTLTVTASPPEGGTVTKNPDKATYVSGDPVTLTAAPATGYQFISWGGDVSATAATIQVTMTKNMAIVANFQSTIPSDTSIVNQIINWIQEQLTKLKEFFESLISGIGAAVKPFIDDSVSFFVTPVKTVVDWVQTHVDDIWHWTQDIIADIESSTGKLTSTISTAVTSAISVVSDWISSSAQDIKSFVMGQLTDVSSFISSVYLNINTTLTTWFNNIWDFITGIPDAITGWIEAKLEDLFSFVEVTGTTAWDRIKKFLQTVWDSFISGPKWLWDQILDFRMRLANMADDNKKWMSENIADPILDAVRNMWNDLGNWFAGIWERITGGIKTFFTVTLPGWFQELWDTLKAGISWVWDKVGDVVSDFLDNIMALIGIHSPILPQGGMGTFTGVIKLGLALVGGLGVMTVAGQLVHPLHSLGLEHVSAMVYDLSNYKVLIGAGMAVIATASIKTPLTYYMNSLLRPWLPSARDAAQMRSRVYITAEEYSQLLAYYGIPDQWHDYMDRLTETKVGYFALAAVARNGVFDSQIFERDLHRSGYANEMVQMLLTMYQKLSLESVKGSMSSTAINRFKEGFTTEEQFAAELALLGYSEQQIPIFTIGAKLMYAYDYTVDLISAYRDAVRKGNLSLDQYRDALLGLGMVVERVEGYVARERARIKPTEKITPIAPPTPTYQTDAGKVQMDTIRRQRRKALITREQEITQLLALGLDTDYANTIAANDDARLGEIAP